VRRRRFPQSRSQVSPFPRLTGRAMGWEAPQLRTGVALLGWDLWLNPAASSWQHGYRAWPAARQSCRGGQHTNTHTQMDSRSEVPLHGQRVKRRPAYPGQLAFQGPMRTIASSSQQLLLPDSQRSFAKFLAAAVWPPAPGTKFAKNCEACWSFQSSCLQTLCPICPVNPLPLALPPATAGATQ
jgi:hypothetical protein